jgi:hypothetical protein
MADQRRIKGAPRRGSGGAGTGSTNGYTGRFALIIPLRPCSASPAFPARRPPQEPAFSMSTYQEENHDKPGRD